MRRSSVLSIVLAAMLAAAVVPPSPATAAPGPTG